MALIEPCTGPVPSLPTKPPRGWRYNRSNGHYTTQTDPVPNRRSLPRWLNGPGIAGLNPSYMGQLNYFTACARTWSALSPTYRAAWGTAASLGPYWIQDGTVKTLSAFELFMQQTTGLEIYAAKADEAHDLPFCSTVFYADPAQLGPWSTFSVTGLQIHATGPPTLTVPGVPADQFIYCCISMTSPYARKRSLAGLVRVCMGAVNLFTPGFSDFFGTYDRMISSLPLGRTVLVHIAPNLSQRHTLPPNLYNGGPPHIEECVIVP